MPLQQFTTCPLPQQGEAFCQAYGTPGPSCSQGANCMKDLGEFVSFLLNQSLWKGGSHGFKGSFCVWHRAALREGTAGSTAHVPERDTASPRTFKRDPLPIATEAHSFTCTALAAKQLSRRDYSPASGMASPGTMPLEAAPNWAADGTVLLQMEGDLGLKLGMEPSAKH